MALIDGDDFVLDDPLPYPIVNKFKNAWYGAAGPGNPQPGMIWVDSGDNKARVWDGAAWNLVGLEIYANSFTYDLTTATGTQAIAGVGFQPTRVEFLTHVNGSNNVASIGWDVGTTQFCFFNDLVRGNDTTPETTFSIVAMEGATPDSQSGQITTLGADGYTITWQKSGTPSGTLLVYFKAYKY